MAGETELKQRVSSQSNIPLDQIIFDGTNKTLDLPKAHGKGASILMYAKFRVGYTTTPPTVKAGGVLGNLVETVEVKDARGLLKDVKIRDLRDSTERLTGNASPLIYTKAATDIGLDSTAVLTGTDLPAPTTPAGDYYTIVESIHMPFECDIALANFLDTMLQYNGKDINTMKLVCNKIDSLFVGGNAVVISGVDIRIDINYHTMANAGLGRRWRQTQTERQFSASVTKARMEMNGVDSLAGLKIEVTKGPLRLPITVDEARQIKFDFAVRKNGVESYLHAEETLLMLNMQDSNKKHQYKIKTQRGYMNFISGNLIESAEQNTYSEMNLLVTLPPASATFVYDVNNPFNVRVLIDEIE